MVSEMPYRGYFVSRFFAVTLHHENVSHCEFVIFKMGKSMITKESVNGQQYKEYITQAAGDKAYTVGAQVLGGELWYN